MTCRVVFVTGATGFLGAEICTELLRTTGHTICCLIRGATDAGAERRTHAVLAAAAGDSYDPVRIVTVRGDITAPRLGLSAATYASLADDVHSVYHCAASVNLAAQYESLCQTNVEGTRGVIRFAQHRRDKPLHHVSTGAVFANIRSLRRDVVSETTAPTRETSDVIGYTQSKYAGEIEVGNAARRGLPTAIYRPALILGHSETGAYSHADVAVRLIRGAVAAGCAPTTNNHVPAAPVDYTARAIVALSACPEALGGAWFPVAAEPLRMADVFSHATTFGYHLPECPPLQWRRALLSAADTTSGFVVLAVWEAVSHVLGFAPDSQTPSLDSTATSRLLAQSGIYPPNLHYDLFRAVLKRAVRTGVLPHPQAQQSEDRDRKDVLR